MDITDRQRIQDDVWADFHGSVWEDRYNDAPTELSRWYMVLKLYVDAFETTYEETLECMTEIYDIYDRMSLEDWMYVYRLCCHVLDLDLKSLALYRVRTKVSDDISYEDWVNLFATQGGRQDAYWWSCVKKMYEQNPGPSGGQRTGE